MFLGRHKEDKALIIICKFPCTSWARKQYFEMILAISLL